MCGFDIEGSSKDYRRNMEEISKDDSSLSKSGKVKKARSAAQMEAFKKCNANRKANIEKRKLGIVEKIDVASVSIPVSTKAEDSSSAVAIANQVEELRKQMEANNRAIEDYKERLRMQYEDKYNMDQKMQNQRQKHRMDEDQNRMEIDEPEHAHEYEQEYEEVKRIHPPPQQQQHHHQIPYRPPIVNTRVGYADSIAFYNPNIANQNQNRKRDIRGMDPYADEKRSMLEKIYTRNTNTYRQNLLEQQRKLRMAGEDSIQILASKVQQQPEPQSQMQMQMQMDVVPSKEPASTPTVDRWDPVENMKALIRGGKSVRGRR